METQCRCRRDWNINVSRSQLLFRFWVPNQSNHRMPIKLPGPCLLSCRAVERKTQRDNTCIHLKAEINQVIPLQERANNQAQVVQAPGNGLCNANVDQAAPATQRFSPHAIRKPAAADRGSRWTDPSGLAIPHLQSPQEESWTGISE